MSSNCVNVNGNMVNVPIRSGVSIDLTDYRSSNERENELRNILNQNGCIPNNSYDARICMQNNSNIVKQFLEKNFTQSLASNVCKRN